MTLSAKGVIRCKDVSPFGSAPDSVVSVGVEGQCVWTLPWYVAFDMTRGFYGLLPPSEMVAFTRRFRPSLEASLRVWV